MYIIRVLNQTFSPLLNILFAYLLIEALKFKIRNSNVFNYDEISC